MRYDDVCIKPSVLPQTKHEERQFGNTLKVYPVTMADIKKKNLFEQKTTNQQAINRLQKQQK